VRGNDLVAALGVEISLLLCLLQLTSPFRWGGRPVEKHPEDWERGKVCVTSAWRSGTKKIIFGKSSVLRESDTVGLYIFRPEKGTA